MSDSTSRHSLGGGMFGKESGASYEVYLNLTPLMDVMSNILFFLLAAFGASAVAVFSVTVPVDASGDPNPSDAPPEDIVQLTMRADATGLTIGCSDPAKLPEDMKICDARIPKKGNAYDTETLSQHLVTIKKTFTGANTVVFVPDDDIKYSTLVQILDVTRDYKQPDGTHLPLFPDVVMSGLVQ